VKEEKQGKRRKGGRKSGNIEQIATYNQRRRIAKN
jgi:hypothetical protein